MSKIAKQSELNVTLKITEISSIDIGYENDFGEFLKSFLRTSVSNNINHTISYNAVFTF
jgi:hypothetical protein